MPAPDEGSDRSSALVGLFRWADLVTVRAEDAAVTLARTEDLVAAGAAVEVLAGVVRHRLGVTRPASRARDDRLVQRHGYQASGAQTRACPHRSGARRVCYTTLVLGLTYTAAAIIGGRNGTLWAPAVIITFWGGVRAARTRLAAGDAQRGGTGGAFRRGRDALGGVDGGGDGAAAASGRVGSHRLGECRLSHFVISSGCTSPDASTPHSGFS